jgi:hypothetical protein
VEPKNIEERKNIEVRQKILEKDKFWLHLLKRWI